MGWPKGVPRSAETRAKISEAQRGRTHTAEARAKMSEAKRGKPSPMRGRTRTAETRAKISEATRAASPLSVLSPEQRADYDVLRGKGGMSRAEALASILRCAR